MCARGSCDVHGGNFGICEASGILITAIAVLGVKVFSQSRSLFFVAADKSDQLRAFAMCERREDGTLGDGTQSNNSKADFFLRHHGCKNFYSSDTGIACGFLNRTPKIGHWQICLPNSRGLRGPAFGFVSLCDPNREALRCWSALCGLRRRLRPRRRCCPENFDGGTTLPRDTPHDQLLGTNTCSADPAVFRGPNSRPENRRI